jgi:hypothetical protein
MRDGVPLIHEVFIGPPERNEVQRTGEALKPPRAQSAPPVNAPTAVLDEIPDVPSGKETQVCRVERALFLILEAAAHRYPD